MSHPSDGPQHFRHSIEKAHMTAIDALAQTCPLSKNELKACFQKGAVWLKQGKQKSMRLRRIKKPLNPGDVIDLYYHPSVLHHTPPEPTLLLDRQAYSIWLKPRGMLSQGSKWGDHSALYRWVEMHYQPDGQPRQAWMVHRLDRATAGLQILAHTKKMAQALSRLFENHEIEKLYQTVVHGEFPETPQTFTAPIDGKPAVTHARRLRFDAVNNLSQLEIRIETGRKHQIRRHLSEAGFPVVGDRLYGDENQDGLLQREARPDLQLTALRLRFTCPLTHETVDLSLSPDQLDLLPMKTD